MTNHSLWLDGYQKIKKDPIALLSFFVIILYAFLALLCLCGFVGGDFAQVNNQNPYAPPSRDYLFGTDIFGRNVLSRALQGNLIALSVGFISTSIAATIGTSLGAIAGYFGGKIDAFVVWLYTTIDSIPYILLIVAFAFVLGQGLSSVYITLGLTSWVQICRLVRGEFIKQRHHEYVLSAQAIGASSQRQIFRHILPNIMHIVAIQFGLGFVQAIKIEVILSYLGLGVEIGTPSWGMMIDNAKLELAQGVWWNLAAATFFMFFLILSVNLFVDALRDALDPKQHGRA